MVNIQAASGPSICPQDVPSRWMRISLADRSHTLALGRANQSVRIVQKYPCVINCSVIKKHPNLHVSCAEWHVHMFLQSERWLILGMFCQLLISQVAFNTRWFALPPGFRWWTLSRSVILVDAVCVLSWTVISTSVTHSQMAHNRTRCPWYGFVRTWPQQMLVSLIIIVMNLNG